MRVNRKSVGAIAVVAACAAPPPIPSSALRPAGSGTVVLRATGFEHRGGQLLISVFTTPDGFPSEHTRAQRNVNLPIDGDTIEVTFADLPAGEVAVSAFHDEDMDFELDSNLFGMPTERWGVSGGARGLLGPPSFADCTFDLAASRRVEVEIVLR
jgi:uncharacterized protein (DUF2141 family)